MKNNIPNWNLLTLNIIISPITDKNSKTTSFTRNNIYYQPVKRAFVKKNDGIYIVLLLTFLLFQETKQKKKQIKREENNRMLLSGKWFEETSLEFAVFSIVKWGRLLAYSNRKMWLIFCNIHQAIHQGKYLITPNHE